MKYLFIVNPVAGGSDRTEEIRSKAEKAFLARPDDEFEIYVTKCKGDETGEVLRRAETGEMLRIISCGGDGTFNGCCNGAAFHSNISVAPYPSGTGNDFCRMFGEEKDLFLNMDAILDGTEHPIDLIDVNGKYCDCIASVGIDARVGTNVHNYTHLPLCHGTGAYVVSLIRELCRGLYTHAKISCGTYSYEGPIMLCSICNGRHYGGGFNPSPTAMPDDGILDIIVVKRMNLFQIAAYIGKYASGRASEMPEKIVDCLHSDSITIDTASETVINCDGESLQTKHAVMKVCSGCMNLLVPKGITFFG